MKAAALELAARRIYVFPLIANGKTPATQHGFQDATTDPKHIEEMWGLLPKSNIGIATGASGLVVIDIDTKHGVNGWKAFDDCLERLGKLLAAMCTGRNDELVRAAARLGGLVYLGGISAEDVRRALLWACSTWRDCDPRKDRDTIERGIRFGLDHPRE